VTVSVENLDSESARSQADRQAAFESLFQDHWERIYGVVFRVVGDPAEAEDLALEAFWKLYNAPHIENPTGWLYRVATNLGLNALRAARRREGYERRAGEISLEAEPTLRPDQYLEQAEQRAQVRRVLAEMKPKSARMLILRYSGLSYAEIAVALRVSPNSVGTLLVRAEKEFERRYRALEGG
jgi:RNA polymerase sigma-70 factor (ECF subfamily)